MHTLARLFAVALERCPRRYLWQAEMTVQSADFGIEYRAPHQIARILYAVAMEFSGKFLKDEQTIFARRFDCILRSITLDSCIAPNLIKPLRL